MKRDYTKPSVKTDNIEETPTVSDKTPIPEKSKNKIFISLPMNGRTEADILNEIETISKKFEAYYDIIDSYHQEEDPNGVDNRSGVWYLGNSIKLMRTADLVVFSRDWYKTRGCIIEHRICEYYDIPYIEMI